MTNEKCTSDNQNKCNSTQELSLIQGFSHDMKKNSSPNLKSAINKTDKIDETDFSLIKNSDFITAIFGNITDSECPIVVSFAGDPNKVKSSAWLGKPWINGKTRLLDSHNNYLSFATFKPDDKSKFKRQKKYFIALYAIMLDDIGIKIPENRINLKPSWKIETSPSNFQIGYLLNEPITDSAVADNLLNSIIKAGLCDPGSNGVCTRIGRLPVAINGKNKIADGSHWRCQLKEWNPECRYSIQEIIDGLQIDPIKSSKLHLTERRKHNQESELYQDDVHIPRANENPVIVALKKSGRYKQPLGDGKHDITCPWVHEHTDQIDHGTAYFDPNESYPLGGFKCQHEHCSNRKVSALHDFLEISRIEAKHKSIIYVQPGELPRICDAAESELAKALRYYQRSGMIVTITTDPGTLETTVRSLTLPTMIRILAGLAIWQSYDKRSKSWVIIDPPEKYIRVLHDATSYMHLPILNGIARQPYLRSNDSLMTETGYDALTGMFGVFTARNFSVPDNPTKQQAGQALFEILDLLSEFAFKTEHDKAAALSGILTAVVRPSLQHAPMFHIKAPTIASGKSYLCELITAFATPQRSTPHTFPADDEECRKLLLAELLTAPAVIEFDNLTSNLTPHKSLCTALTSEFISGRILGQSKTAEVGTKVLFLSSGNNVDPVRDMTRRTVTINLDPACEIPAARDFQKQPVNEVRTNRERFVSLALTIIFAWICAGKPKTECKTIATYSDWSDYCRQSLLWLGMHDPAACIFEAMNEDPDRELLGDFLKIWFKCFKDSPTSIKNAIKLARSISGEELHEIIVDIVGNSDGNINRNRLGWWIKRHAGQIVNGFRFVKDTSKHNAAKWKVESVFSN